MFNREIKIGLVKKTKSPRGEKSEETVEDVPFIDITQLVRETTETVAKNVMLGIGLYMMLDTFRKVLIKATPEG